MSRSAAKGAMHENWYAVSILKLPLCKVCDKLICFIGRLLGLRATPDCGAFIHPMNIIAVAAPDAPFLRPVLPFEVCQNPCPTTGLDILNHNLSLPSMVISIASNCPPFIWPSLKLRTYIFFTRSGITFGTPHRRVSPSQIATLVRLQSQLTHLLISSLIFILAFSLLIATASRRNNFP